MGRNKYDSEEWQRIKNDPELHEAELARRRDLYHKNLEKEHERSHLKYLRDKERILARHRAHYAKNKEYWREYWKKRRLLHHDRDAARHLEWVRNNPEKVAAQGRRHRNGPNRAQYLKTLRYQPHRHYLSKEKYDEIYPRLLAGPCEICGATGPMRIDHCHTRNVFRGVICDRCNRGIGFLKESEEVMKRAIEYLARSKETN